MSLNNEKICRFCFKVPYKKCVERIDDITREMCDVLLLKMNLDVSKDPVICQDCAEIAERTVHFKSKIIDTEELIRVFAAGNDMAKINLEDIFEDSEEIDGSFNICRFCMSPIKSIPIVLMKDATFAEMLPVYMPELDLDIVENAVICTHCSDNLKDYFHLVRSCSDTEAKINTYCQLKGTNQVNLHKIRRFLLKNPNETRSKPHNPLIASEKTIDVIQGQVDSSKRTSDTTVNNFSEIYRCPVCSLETRYKKSLERHMLLHKDPSEVHTYKCGLCTYETIEKGNLKRHRKLVHKKRSEVKVYKCAKCTYETGDKDDIIKHMSVHRGTMCTFNISVRRDSLGVGKYECSICGVRNKRRDNLKRHMLVHKKFSEEEMYKCASCTFITKRKHNLIRHIKQKHNFEK